MSSPTSTHLTDVEAMQVIKTVKQRSQDLVAFIEDLLPRLNKSSLQALEAGELSKVVNQDLRDRINMRLTLIAGDVPDKETGIAFDVKEPPRAGQRFRTGSKNGRRVLVEYFYYDETESGSETFNLRQVRRISALHAEVKSRAFHSMQGVGFLRESLHQKRYGIIYQTPEEAGSHGFSSLSDLFSTIPLVPLEIRMRTAHALCEALLNLHSIGWYHKSIKSQNILCFGQDSEVRQEFSYAAWNLDCPYLIGFDCSRPSDAETRGTVDFMTPNNIYRHPDRWGNAATFERHHDIYALVSFASSFRIFIPVYFKPNQLTICKGILLLEVGCWKLLKESEDKREIFENIIDPEHLRTLLLGSSLDKTTHMAGTRFASAIRFCLEKRRWSDLEEWQVQKMMRQSVLEPLKACCSSTS